MSDQDRQDEDLEKRTNQVDPSDEISNDEDLADELDSVDSLQTQLLGEVDDKDWHAALETADTLQETTNRIHAYIAGKAS